MALAPSSLMLHMPIMPIRFEKAVNTEAQFEKSLMVFECLCDAANAFIPNPIIP